MQGWVKVHRQIQDNSLWNDKPFDRTHAWLDLIINANHQDQEVILGNEIINIKRGSRITSMRKLSERWGWSNTKVENFLKLLQNQNMITYFSDTKKTTINIVNYNVYQDKSDTENETKTTQERHENDTKTKRKRTNKNDKEGEECKNDNKSLSDLEKTIEDYKIMRKSLKKPMTDRAVELMLSKLDKLSKGDESIKIKILEQSIENSWLGIFELKQPQANNYYSNNQQPQPTKGLMDLSDL